MQNPDILHEISTHAGARRHVIVGFAAETGDATGSVLDLARAKLARKGCDLLVVNDVSGGAVFGSPDNEAVILAPTARPADVPHGTKTALAHVIWDEVARRSVRDAPVPRRFAGETPVLHAGPLILDFCAAAPTTIESEYHRGWTPLHLGVRDRGSPRQDR